MSADAPTPTTKREVMIARAAFVAACNLAVEHFGWEYNEARYRTWPGSQALAAARYPLPTVTRPRVVEVPTHSRSDGAIYPALRFRAMNGVIEAEIMGRWRVASFDPTADRVAVWVALLANPTETVEDDTP